MGSCADIHDAEPCGEHVIQVADERTLIATTRGSLRLDNATVLHDVVVVPGITRTLISVAALFKDGMHVSFSGHKCEVFGRLLFSGVVRGGIYELQGGTSRSAAASALVAQAPKYIKNDLRHWHQRLAHLNYNSILELENSGKVKGLKIVGPRVLNDKCEACALSKVTARSAPKKATRPQLSKDEVCHADLAGPMQRSIHGNHYFLALKWIGFTHISFLRNKSDAAAAFEDYLAIVNRRSENQPHLIKVLKSDNGGEFEGTAFQRVCSAAGIEREYSEPHAHYQNGVVERAIRTISETARTLLVHSGLPHNLWEYAARHAVYVRNRVLSRSYPNATPYERYYGHAPDVSQLHVFGERVVAKIPRSKRNTRYKFRERGKAGVFVGHDNERKGYFIYFSAGGPRIQRTCDVVFMQTFPTFAENPPDTTLRTSIEPLRAETDSRGMQAAKPTAAVPVLRGSRPMRPAVIETFARGSRLTGPAVTDTLTRVSRLTGPAVTEPSIRGSRPTGPAVTYPQSAGGPQRALEDSDLSPAPHVVRNADDLTNAAVEQINGTSELTRRRRSERISSRLIGHALAVLCEVVKEPITLAEARRSPNWPLWETAIREEIESLRANNTFDVVTPPAGAHVIGCTVKFRVKRDGNCNVDRLRARLCAQGFSQVFLVDYGETYSPVARLVSVRIFLALATRFGLRVCQCDVPSAYVKAPLDTVIYMRQLRGFETGEPGTVWRLKKALYGLKQAGKEWHDEINAFFIDYGFSATREDACVYVLPDNSVMVLLYVDDILIGYSDQVAMSKLVEALRAKYDVKYLGDITWFLGMRIKVDTEANTTTIDQFQFATEILQRFAMENCKPSVLPLNSGCFLTSGDEKDELADHIPYRAAVGALLYLSRVSRPDISFAVNQVAAHVNRPTVSHWTAVKQILRYVAGTLHMALVYKQDENATPVELFTDADWANNTEDRKSISGVVVRLYGCAVAWVTRRQSVVAKSSTAAEFIAASIGVEEARWTRMLLQSLSGRAATAIAARVDNQSTIARIVNDKSSEAQKTVDCMFFDMKDAFKRGEVVITYCPTEEMIADFLTKALNRLRLKKMLELIGLQAIKR